jgi:hypothetical protein
LTPIKSLSHPQGHKDSELLLKGGDVSRRRSFDRFSSISQS